MGQPLCMHVGKGAGQLASEQDHLGEVELHAGIAMPDQDVVNRAISGWLWQRQ